MKRSTLAVVSVAAVIGIAGGAMVALIRGDEPGTPDAAAEPTGTPTTTASATVPTSTPTDSPADVTGVLYAGNGTIHDGDRAVEYDAPFDTPDRLVRAAQGWLITHATSPQEPSFRIYHVAPDGTTTVIADVLGRFDLDETGTHVVAAELESGMLMTWALDGTIEQTWDGPRGLIRPVWSGETVFASELGDDGAWRLWSWTPGSKATRLDAMGYPELVAAPDGSLLAGAVGLDGNPVAEQNYCFAATTVPGAGSPNSWFSCDWRRYGDAAGDFSPDSRLLLAVPSQTDGFGPGRFGTFSATTGPSEELAYFDTPDLTMGAEWIDSDHLALIGATDADLDDQTGRWIKRCDLEGVCTDVATREHGTLVLGEPS